MPPTSGTTTHDISPSASLWSIGPPARLRHDSEAGMIPAPGRKRALPLLEAAGLRTYPVRPGPVPIQVADGICALFRVDSEAGRGGPRRSAQPLEWERSAAGRGRRED